MASIKNRLTEISDVFSTKYKSHVNKFQKLCDTFYTTQAQMESLKSVKGSIDENRFNQQEKEYQSILDHIGPQIAETRQIIENFIDELQKKNVQLQNEINTNQDKINQETVLLESGALSREKYTEIINPIKKELKRQQREANKIQKNISFLQNAIRPPASKEDSNSKNHDDSKKTKNIHENDFYNNSPARDKEAAYSNEFSHKFNEKNSSSATQQHHYSSQRTDYERSRTGGFGKDFGTGCLYVFLAFFGLIVLGILLQVGSVLVYPFIVIACIVIFMAATGRLVNFLKRKW